MSENVAMAANVEQGPTRKYICCVPVEAKENTVTLGSVYGAVVKLLKARGWRRLKSSTQRPGAADLILGGPCGAGIPWKALRVHRRRNPASDELLPLDRPAGLVGADVRKRRAREYTSLVPDVPHRRSGGRPTRAGVARAAHGQRAATISVILVERRRQGRQYKRMDTLRL